MMLNWAQQITTYLLSPHLRAKLQPWYYQRLFRTGVQTRPDARFSCTNTLKLNVRDTSVSSGAEKEEKIKARLTSLGKEAQLFLLTNRTINNSK